MTREEINERLEIEKNNLEIVRVQMRRADIVDDKYQYFCDEELRIMGNIELLELEVPENPKGVTPNNIWYRKVILERTNELEEAMRRYIDAGLIPPIIWGQELDHHRTLLESNKNNFGIVEDEKDCKNSNADTQRSPTFIEHRIINSNGR